MKNGFPLFPFSTGILWQELQYGQFATTGGLNGRFYFGFPRGFGRLKWRFLAFLWWCFLL
jgi:hypothetical protein